MSHIHSDSFGQQDNNFNVHKRFVLFKIFEMDPIEHFKVSCECCVPKRFWLK